MPVTISKAVARKVDLQALRRQAQAQVRQMEALLEQINSALGEVSPRHSPLDEVKEVIESTQDLRVANGNISAERLAKLYGVSLSELAGWLSRSRQAVTKTPDADSLQPALRFFERVARLRLGIKGDSAFRKWLRTPINF